MSDSTAPRRAKRRFSTPVIVAGGLSSLLLAFSFTPTFSALTAAITNNGNTAGTGTLVMEEYDSTNALKCTSGISATAVACADVNKYGGNLAMIPGQTVTTTLSLKNAGSVAANTFTVLGGTCTQSSNGSTNGTATDLCSKYDLTIKSGSTNIYTGTAAALGGQTIDIKALLGSSVAAGATVPLTVTATLNSTAGNTYEGLKILQALTWTFGS